MYKKFSSKTTGAFTGLVETWKPVTDFEDSYEVSSFGNVRSKDRFRDGKHGSTVPVKGRLMALKISKSGYAILGLCKNGKKHFKSVHRLVAEHFIKNTDLKPTVNHIDGVKTNNNVSNLEWSTHSEQMIHAVKNDLLEKRGTPKYTKKFKQEILEYYLSNPMSLRKLADKFSVSERTAGRIVKDGVFPRKVTCVTNGGLVVKDVVTLDVVRRIKELRSQGLTLKAIGQKFNLGTSQVWRICKEQSRNNNYEEI